jgi:6,7-dimethyl-8-ribityllumazine synthase
MARADRQDKNKGGEAARACLQMLDVKKRFRLYPR